MDGLGYVGSPCLGSSSTILSAVLALRGGEETYHRVDLDFRLFPRWQLFLWEFQTLMLYPQTSGQGVSFRHPDVRVWSLR